MKYVEGETMYDVIATILRRESEPPISEQSRREWRERQLK